jgi:hypothetical protein
MNQRDIEKAIEREVEDWPGASVTFANGGKHPKAKLSYGGALLSVVFAGTPGSQRSIHNTLRDVRGALKKLGATRTKPEPSKDEDEAPYRKPNDGAEKRPDPVAREPVEPKPDVAEQLVAAGVATEEQKVEALRKDVVEKVASAIAEAETEEEAEDIIAAIRAAAAAIVDGVYFDLPDTIYHAVPRLSASGLQRLAISPATFWRGSWLDPERPEADEEATKAQVLGKAYHVARLEPDRFHSSYVRAISKSDYPAKGLLTSDAAIKAALKELGEPQTQGAETIPDRARRLVDAGYQGTILALEVERWEAERNGRVAIPAEHFDQIVVDMERIRESEIAGLLSDGFAEVSIFWTDKHGLKMKARLDWLTLAHWADLKTFANPNGKELDRALVDFCRYNRLHIQAATYRDATEAVRTGGLDVVGPATEAQRKLIFDLRTRAKPLGCYFVFTEKGGVPNLLAREFPFYDVSAYRETEIDALVEEGRRGEVRETLGSMTLLYQRALWEIDRGKRAFVLYSEVYEPGRPWFPIEAIGKFSDLDFNTYWLEGKA